MSKHEHAWLSSDGSMRDEMLAAGMKCLTAWPEDKWDVFVGHGVGGWSYDGAFQLAKSKGMKTVEVMHSNHISLTMPEVCDAFVGLNQITTNINLHMPRARKIYGVIDWENYPKQSTGKKIGRLSRLVHEKNPQSIIGLARKFPNEEFVIAGGGPLEDEIRRLAPKNLEVLGMVRNMHEFYYQLKVFAFSTVDECCCMSVAMAQAAGIPVVCSKIHSLLETTGGNALFASNFDEFAGAVSWFLEEPNRAQVWGNVGRNFVKANFNSVEKWDSLIEELL
jgi:glycosyltransferase involved in cell wall biosynthesis